MFLTAFFYTLAASVVVALVSFDISAVHTRRRRKDLKLDASLNCGGRRGPFR